MTCWDQCDAPEWLPCGWFSNLMVRVTRFESIMLEDYRTVGDRRSMYKAVSHWWGRLLQPRRFIMLERSRSVRWSPIVLPSNVTVSSCQAGCDI
jgi:hypothetical protein